MDFPIAFLNAIWKLLWEMSPYLLLGLFVAGILHVYVNEGWIVRYIGKDNFRSSWYAALLGVPLPLCSCGVIPVGLSLYQSGASRAGTVSFLISTPQTGVDSIFATSGMLNFPFACVRVFAAFISGVLGGYWAGKAKVLHSKKSIPVPLVSERGNKVKRLFRYALSDLPKDIAVWLVIGLLIAAFLEVLIPENFFESYIDDALLSYFFILLIAVPMYVCATGSIPIALVLIAKGFSPGAALIFLMAGPATNSATLSVLAKVLGKITLWKYLIAIITGALFFAFTIDYLLPRAWFSVHSLTPMSSHDHYSLSDDPLKSMFLYGMSLLCSFVIVRGFFVQRIARLRSRRQLTDASQDILILRVEGMNCSKCKRRVETALQSLSKSITVHAFPESHRVEIMGSLSEEKAKETIEALGYSCKGRI